MRENFLHTFWVDFCSKLFTAYPKIYLKYSLKIKVCYEQMLNSSNLTVKIKENKMHT